jgi:hypothetical protein
MPATWNEIDVDLVHEERKEPDEEEKKRIEEAARREQLEGYSEAPSPYNADDIDEKFRDWMPDYHDQLIPRRLSFLSDFVYHTRGIMTPTLACLWSALFLLQAAVKREAWIKWHPKPLYTNQYIIIIGPAGKVKKTTAVNDTGLPILRKFRGYIRDRNLYEMKQVTIIKDKSTPEAMISAMLPEHKEGADYYLQNPDGSFIEDELGKAIRYTRTSEASIIISELAVMLSKRSYADSMIENLLDLYDPHDDWEWRREGQGTKKLRHVCTSLIGGTTVDGFRSSIPHAAKGDGFLSRTVLVYVPATKRIYPMPFLPRGAPNTEEMAKRLAWIAEHALGEYRLTDEALKIYRKWYMLFNKRMEDDPSLAGAISRMDINVLKTALLIRIARYDEAGQEIDGEDLLDSIRLVETTYQAVPYLLGQLDDDMILSMVAKAEVFMSRKKRIDRMHFLGAMKMRSDIASIVIGEMIARGEIGVEYQGKRLLNVLGKSEEEYVWLHGDDEGAGAFDEIWHGENYTNSLEVRLSTEVSRSPRGLAHSPAEVLAERKRRVQRDAKRAKKQGFEEAKREPCEVGSGASESAASEEPCGDYDDDGLHSGSGENILIPTEEGSEEGD